MLDDDLETAGRSTLQPGDRVRHAGEQYVEAFIVGTATVTEVDGHGEVLVEHDRKGSRSWPQYHTYRADAAEWLETAGIDATLPTRLAGLHHHGDGCWSGGMLDFDRRVEHVRETLATPLDELNARRDRAQRDGGSG